MHIRHPLSCRGWRRRHSNKEPYDSWHFCEKRPAPKGILCIFATLYLVEGGEGVILTPFELRKLEKNLRTAWWGKNSKKNGKKIVCAAWRGKLVQFFEKKMGKNVSATFSRHLSECLRVTYVARAAFILQEPLTATRCNFLQLTATHCYSLQLTANHCKSLQQISTIFFKLPSSS